MTSLLLLVCLTLPAQPPPVRVVPAKNPTQVEVIAALPAKALPKLPQGKLTQDQGETVLRLALLSAGEKEPGVAMLGNYERRKDELIFRPRFALQHGQRYRVFFEPAPGKVTTADYMVPARKPTPPAIVEKIYPTADVLPANHLRFHIHFSKPMRGGPDLFEHIQLLDADGKVIDDPWLTDELWDADGKQLVLYIHPGRIKWGLLLRMLLGPVLEPDRRYTLVIGGGLLDANGQPLGKDVRKPFRTSAEDRVRIDLKAWKLSSPTAGTKTPLVLTLPKPVDVASLEQYVTVTDIKGVAIKGRVTVGATEKTWTFQPEQPWREGKYQVKVNGRLEDPCGNTPLRPFDLDVDTPRLPDQPLTLPFQTLKRTK